MATPETHEHHKHEEHEHEGRIHEHDAHAHEHRHDAAGQEQAKKTLGLKIKPLYIAAGGMIAAVIVIYLAMVYISGSQVVTVGETINVTYVGTFTNGTIFDSSAGRPPLQFKVGAGQLISGFDQGVVGMKVGQNKTLVIPPALGYGMMNQSLIMQAPINAFGNQSVRIGMAVTRSANGQMQQGMVIAVNKTSVTANFNSPLAGQTLIFKIKVLSIMKS